KGLTTIPSKTRLSASGAHPARWSTRWEAVQGRCAPSPTARRAALTVRCPAVSSAPVTSVRTDRKVGHVKATAKGGKTRHSRGAGRPSFRRPLPLPGTAIRSPILHGARKWATVESFLTATLTDAVRLRETETDVECRPCAK